MGRAFSVFMFCAAMDPVYWALNRIPRVLAVEGYVDDCTVAGNLPQRASLDLAPMSWIQSVRSVFAAVRTAGFHVLDHSCFWVAAVPGTLEFTGVLHAEPLPEGSLTDPLRFPTLDAAVAHAVEAGLAHRGKGLAVVGREQAWLALTPVMVASYRIGRKAAWAFPLLAASCRCKAKTSVFLNAQLSPPALRKLDQSGYGAHSVIMQDTQLGLQLLGRYGLSPAGRQLRGLLLWPRQLPKQGDPFRRALLGCAWQIFLYALGLCTLGPLFSVPSRTSALSMTTHAPISPS